MAEWVTIPSFTNGQVIQAEDFQDLWQDVYHLHDREYRENQLTDETNIWSTTSASFADVDGTKLSHTFQSYGGDLLVAVAVRYGAGGVNGSLYTRFELDGTAYGNANGLARFQQFSTNSRACHQMTYLFQNVDEGTHRLDVQFASPSGTAFYSEDVCNKFWILELT